MSDDGRKGPDAQGPGARLPRPRGESAGRPSGAPRDGVRREDRPAGATGNRSAAAERAALRRTHLRRRILLGLAAVMVVIVAAGALVVHHLNGNIRTVAIPKGLVGTETTDAKGRAPINVLVMGSDTRGSSADCAIGGGCQASTSTASGKSATSLAANADVEMLVHISADRSNATIMSIPRDTVVDIPECTDPATGQPVAAHRERINSSLQYGPSCTLKTVHNLTGVPIDHFAVIDFSGVVTMSDAVGGVNVCVNHDVYDTYSHLKLKKGSHTLKGKSALEFLRTRHGFGDGSDIGRTVAQHLFLSAMLRQMESASTLANPVRLYDLANAATKAVTVDNGLGDIGKLTGLAKELNKIPSKRITFTTMPNIPDPQNQAEVLPASNAAALFAKIKSDTSLTASPEKTPTGGSSSTPGSSSTVTPSPGGGTTPGEGTTPTTGATGSGTDYATTVDKAVGCAQVAQVATVQINGIAMTPIQAYAASPNVPDSAP
ncbi:LCP family protein [Allobranchiibius sp. GilTou38]|uniref:LCP family protein n=1 Tax=Allobranchiibius sp. GilTou38 TaxID=2815210 RepID=UPI001AA1C939|nr:LCP family protein [Allobranchiibius sp. GilTou38]MBO1768157.1 LCP family protein [Allobranchiibius sp. GilTou38]